MNTGQYVKEMVKNRKGAVAVIVALVLPVLLFVVAFAIDIGYLANTKNELQNIADATALAGARALGRLYECNGQLNPCTEAMSYEDQLTYAPHWIVGYIIAMVADQNRAGEMDGISIRQEDIEYGIWDFDSEKPQLNPPNDTTTTNAVQVTARRDTSANSPITTFFAGVMGIDSLDVSADATAALSGLGSVPEGALPIPVAINKSWMDTLPCKENLDLYPSSEPVCAGWHTYDGIEYSPPNADTLRDLIKDITEGNYESPETHAGETQYAFTGGTVASIFQDEVIQDLFETMKVKNDGVLDMDENSETWTTTVAVFDDSTISGCNPTQKLTIVGFATIVITKVVDAPEKLIYGAIVCDMVVDGAGGGTFYGTLASIPRLVE